jgi:hypothetical protein
MPAATARLRLDGGMEEAPRGALRHVREDSLLLQRPRITFNELQEGTSLKGRGGDFQAVG